YETSCWPCCRACLELWCCRRCSRLKSVQESSEGCLRRCPHHNDRLRSHPADRDRCPIGHCCRLSCPGWKCWSVRRRSLRLPTLLRPGYRVRNSASSDC